MRTKDEFKQDSIIEATIKLVNDIGFVASSVSKIAKEAGVSPATLYIYYKNKEDLLISTYKNIKRSMSRSILRNINDNMPIRDTLKQIWENIFSYVAVHQGYFQFSEQFANSPYSELVDQTEMEQCFIPIIEVLQKGKEQKIIKNVSFDMLSAFMFFPAMSLANSRLCENFDKNDENIELAFNLAWDAIRY